MTWHWYGDTARLGGTHWCQVVLHMTSEDPVELMQQTDFLTFEGTCRKHAWDRESEKERYVVVEGPSFAYFASREHRVKNKKPKRTVSLSAFCDVGVQGLGDPQHNYARGYMRFEGHTYKPYECPFEYAVYVVGSWERRHSA